MREAVASEANIVVDDSNEVREKRADKESVIHHHFMYAIFYARGRVDTRTRTHTHRSRPGGAGYSAL